MRASLSWRDAEIEELRTELAGISAELNELRRAARGKEQEAALARAGLGVGFNKSSEEVRICPFS